ncbi:MAG: DoxX family protein [Proteobacteria bacterium]|nr:DoxX family protein [Pseudomonadota bacterium]
MASYFVPLRTQREPRRAGWVLAALITFFLLPASVAPKLMGAEVAVASLTAIGWPSTYLVELGMLELALLLLFLWPRTALLGAVLFTALLGGTVASHLRAGSPLASHTLFGIYLGVFLWASLFLRDAAFRAYVPQSTAGEITMNIRRIVVKTVLLASIALPAAVRDVRAARIHEQAEDRPDRLRQRGQQPRPRVGQQGLPGHVLVPGH